MINRRSFISGMAILTKAWYYGNEDNYWEAEEIVEPKNMHLYDDYVVYASKTIFSELVAQDKKILNRTEAPYSYTKIVVSADESLHRQQRIGFYGIVCSDLSLNQEYRIGTSVDTLIYKLGGSELYYKDNYYILCDYLEKQINKYIEERFTMVGVKDLLFNEDDKHVLERYRNES